MRRVTAYTGGFRESKPQGRFPNPYPDRSQNRNSGPLSRIFRDKGAVFAPLVFGVGIW